MTQISVPLLLFGGFFLQSESVPTYFIWLKYISWFYYGAENLYVTQWEEAGACFALTPPKDMPESARLLMSLLPNVSFSFKWQKTDLEPHVSRSVAESRNTMISWNKAFSSSRRFCLKRGLIPEVSVSKHGTP